MTGMGRRTKGIGRRFRAMRMLSANNALHHLSNPLLSAIRVSVVLGGLRALLVSALSARPHLSIKFVFLKKKWKRFYLMKRERERKIK